MTESESRNHTVPTTPSFLFQSNNNNNSGNSSLYLSPKRLDEDNYLDQLEEDERKTIRAKMTNFQYNMNGTKLAVLCLLCLQNSVFTVLRRYSQGILKENYSSYEVLLVGEIVKLVFSAFMIRSSANMAGEEICSRLSYLSKKSMKMAVLAFIYGAMNILSFLALRNIGAGTFTIFAQCKILTTASFSAVMLNRSYSWSQWRALIQLMVGVLLFSVNLFDKNDDGDDADTNTNTTSWESATLGIAAVVTEVTLSGFASIYFEKVIKHDTEQLGIWERNYQLALGSIPIYILFILHAGGGEVGYGGGWSYISTALAMLGAAGGLLVALSIKHGDSILKTLATTGAIVLSSFLDYYLLSGPLTFVMVLGGINVVLAICSYSFDATPKAKALHEPSLSTMPQDRDASKRINLSLKGQDDESMASRPSTFERQHLLKQKTHNK